MPRMRRKKTKNQIQGRKKTLDPGGQMADKEFLLSIPTFRPWSNLRNLYGLLQNQIALSYGFSADSKTIRLLHVKTGAVLVGEQAIQTWMRSELFHRQRRAESQLFARGSQPHLERLLWPDLARIVLSYLQFAAPVSCSCCACCAPSLVVWTT